MDTRDGVYDVMAEKARDSRAEFSYVERERELFLLCTFSTVFSACSRMKWARKGTGPCPLLSVLSTSEKRRRRRKKKKGKGLLDVEACLVTRYNFEYS